MTKRVGVQKNVGDPINAAYIIQEFKITPTC
jgi:hypothetical protein